MLPVYLYGKRIPLKKLTTYSTAPFHFLHKDGLIFNPTLLEFCKNHFFINFCSLADLSSPELDSRTASSAAKTKPKFSKKLAKESSYTISYLINSCGLSPEKAISVSEKVHFETPERPNSVLTLLKKHGFSSTHIANLVRKKPLLLLYNPEKTLLPKLEFFKSIGFSKDRLGSTISREPTLLVRSLENHIIPSYNFLKSMPLTDEKVLAAMKRAAWVSTFLEDPAKNLVPNITVLKELSVPQSCIILLLTHHPEAIMQKSDKFRTSVSKVVEMGFNPLNSLFVLALHAISGNGKTWARCYKTYSKLGWSKDDIYMAFRKHPNCMIMSEKKISKTMDFLVNKMGWESKMIVLCPAVLFLSLENRTIPRCSTVQFLISRGLIKKDVRLGTMLFPKEKYFLEKFVTKYEKQVPGLYDFYKGKIGIEEL